LLWQTTDFIFRAPKKLCDLHTHLLGMGTAYDWMGIIEENATLPLDAHQKFVVLGQA
jgi:hypothetical protein